MNTTTEAVRTIRQYFANNHFYREDVESLSEFQSLVESGVVDSMGILGLVIFLEETFSLRIPDEDVAPENLDSIERIVAYLRKRQVTNAGSEARAHEG